MRLVPDERRLIGRAVDNTGNKSLVARVLGVSIKTIRKWCKRRSHLQDRKRKPKESKATPTTELFILALRNTFHWGSERIQKALHSLPQFMLDALKNLGVQCVQGITLSRTAINNVLKKHGLNGYKHKQKSWQFFRAQKPNELWQLDIKGPFTVQGKRYYFLICIDDYSRYLLLAEQLGSQNEATALKKSWKYRRAKLRNFLNNPTPGMMLP